MPKRTAKMTRSDQEVIMEKETPEHADENQSESQNSSMLNLDNLKELIFLGKLRETVDIAGYKFVVTTLSVKQQKKVLENIMTQDQSARILDIKPLTVSYALESVNGVSPQNLCDDDSLTTEDERRAYVIMNMQSVIVERLYKAYENLVEESNREVGIENLDS